MTALDTAKAVLAKASLFDQTFATPDLGIAIAWAEALGDIGKEDALSVVTRHYATESRRLMPVDVLAGVRKIRADRLRVAGNGEPDYDGADVAGGLRAIRRHRARIASGWVAPPDPVGVGPRRAELEKMIADTSKRMPRMPGCAS